MSRRIQNYRSGDRAEDLGIFLLKAFCAVAPIPRQEDFGLADAVATLLRPEGRFWYAEDSFIVQFKSRTVKEVELNGPLFYRWLAQDLSVNIGWVNLLDGTIELFTLGAILFDRRIHDANGLVVWLIDGEDGLRDGILHLKLEKPVLKWSTGDTENSDSLIGATASSSIGSAWNDGTGATSELGPPARSCGRQTRCRRSVRQSTHGLLPVAR